MATAHAWADAPSRRSGDVGSGHAKDADTFTYTGADPLLPALAGLLVLAAGLLLTNAARRARSAQG